MLANMTLYTALYKALAAAVFTAEKPCVCVAWVEELQIVTALANFKQKMPLPHVC